MYEIFMVKDKGKGQGWAGQRRKWPDVVS